MNTILQLWMGVGLRGRLLVLVTSMLLLGGVAIEGLQLRQAADDYRSDLAREIEHTMDLLEVSLAARIRGADSGSLREYLVDRAQQPLIDEIRWRGASGAVIGVHSMISKTRNAPDWFHHYLAIGESERSRAVVVGAENLGVVQVHFTGVVLENRLWREARNELWFFALEMVLLVVIIFALLGRWLAPLQRITVGGRRFLEGDYDVHIGDSVHLVPEIRTVVEMLNQAAARVGRLVQSLSEQRRATDNAVIVVESGLDGIITYVNDRFCEVSGYRREEVIGRDHRFLNSGQHPKAFFEEMWATIKRGETWFGEVCNRNKNGALVWLLTTITPVMDTTGKPLKYISVRVDITRRKVMENVLLQQAQIIDQIRDSVFSTDLRGVLVSWNAGAERLFGYSADEALGQPIEVIATPDGRAGFFSGTCRRLLHDAAGSAEIRLRRKSGETFDAYLSLTLLKDYDGSELGVAGYALDISERKAMERALRNSEARLAKAQRMARLGNWEWDVPSDAVTGSTEAYRIFGLAPAPLDFEAFLRTVHPADRELVEQSVLAALAGEITYSVDFRVQPAEGPERVIHSEAETERDADGRVVWMTGTVQDITERTRAEQEMRGSKEQLRELSSHLQTVREQEKAMIAREIHDELGGNLTALKMDVYWLANKLPVEMDTARAKVDDMAHLVDSSIHAMRRIVTELRPTVLDDLGLLAAMKWQASEFAKRFGIQCKVIMHGEEIVMGEEYRVVLFRIFQEALTNVARYSKANLVLVDMWLERDKIALEIVDNGIGIPEGTIMNPTSHGIRGMVERARSLGGAVEIGTAPDEGVTISVRIPLPAAGEVAS